MGKTADTGQVKKKRTSFPCRTVAALCKLQMSPLATVQSSNLTTDVDPSWPAWPDHAFSWLVIRIWDNDCWKWFVNTQSVYAATARRPWEWQLWQQNKFEC